MRHRLARLPILLGLVSLAAPAVLAAPPEVRLPLVREAGFTPDGKLRIELDPPSYRELWDRGRGVIDRFPLPDGRRVDLELASFQLLTPDAAIVNVDGRGAHTLPRPNVRFYRGTVAGDAGSLVVLSLFQNRIAGLVRTFGEEFGIGPRAMSLDSPEAMQLEVWTRSAEGGDWVCDDAPGATRRDGALAAGSASSPAPRSHLGGAQLALDLAVESTTEWCAHFGDDPGAAQLYLLNTVAAISAIYDAEVTLLVQVPFLRTFCGTADPYTDGLTHLGDRSQLLDELEAEWSANMGAVSRTVTHLYSHSDDAGVAGGLAQTYVCSGMDCTDVLCDTDFGYGVNLLPAGGGSPASFEINVAAHELGHNHSSPHTNCLQDGGGQWLSTCAIDTCGNNPWCQGTGCFPGPVDTDLTGTLMSTGCDARIQEFDDNVVESIVRGAAEGAACVGAAGLPGGIRTETGGLEVSRVAECPTESLQNDDGTVNFIWSACDGCQYAWIKRVTPSCYPFRLTAISAMTLNVTVGRPVRLLVYSDPAGTGDPADASLVHAEDVTVQTVGPPGFNDWTLGSPVTVSSGDLYIGLYDLQADTPAPGIAAMDTSVSGDSYNAINSTAPGSFSPRAEGTWMIRGAGGPVPGGTVALTWGPPCNDATTPGQDFAVYRGDIGVFDAYTDLTCSTGGNTGYVAEAAPDDSFFLVVPHTTPSEGSYGLKRDPGSGPDDRDPAASPCKPQDFEVCP